MGAQPDTSTSAPEVRHGIRQILAPIFVAKLLATYLARQSSDPRSRKPPPLNQRLGDLFRNTGKIPGDVPRQAGCPRQRTSSGSGGITAALAMSRRLPR